MRLGDGLTDTRRRPLPKPLLVVSCVALCAACLDEPSDPGATGRAAAADLFSAWPGDESLRIAAEPSLVVGSDESLPLGRVSGAVFFGDGVAIADRMSYEVLILDAAGRLLARQGRKGEGPGDYMNLNAIARHADGLVTSDASFLFRATRARRVREVHRGDEAQPGRLSNEQDRWSLRKQRAARNLGDGMAGSRARRADGDPAAGEI